ncbi:MAG: hypothetical protein ACSLEY_00530 [Candidatus Saccharimonadales bacterium]
MKAKFNSDNDNHTHNHKQRSEMFKGGYEGMMRERKKMLPEMQDAIQEALDEWNGESIVMIVMKEDENGLPNGTHTIATGVARPQMQIAMGKALTDMAEHIMHTIMDVAKDDPKAMLDIAEALIDEIKRENK